MWKEQWKNGNSRIEVGNEQREFALSHSFSPSVYWPYKYGGWNVDVTFCCVSRFQITKWGWGGVVLTFASAALFWYTYFVCLYQYITFVYLSITAQCPCNCGTQICRDARRDAFLSDDSSSTVGQLDYSHEQNIIAQVKTCLDSWERHILHSKEFLLRSHFLGHICHDISHFVSYLVDTIYWAITSGKPTNTVTYSCEHRSVTNITKYTEAVGFYVNESGQLKYQFSISVTVRFGRIIKFNPYGDGYDLTSHPTQILTAIEKAIRHQRHIKEETMATSDQKLKRTTYPCSGTEGLFSKMNLNGTGAPTTGQS